GQSRMGVVQRLLDRLHLPEPAGAVVDSVDVQVSNAWIDSGVSLRIERDGRLTGGLAVPLGGDVDHPLRVFGATLGPQAVVVHRRPAGATGHVHLLAPLRFARMHRLACRGPASSRPGPWLAALAPPLLLDAARHSSRRAPAVAAWRRSPAASSAGALAPPMIPLRVPVCHQAATAVLEA